MDQYTPEVTDADIERIVARDYPANLHDTIRDLIRGVEVREKTRVVVACLKCSRGNFERLKGNLADASGYYREIISEAEYPNYTKVWFHIDRVPPEERDRIIEKDKRQYLEWLHRTGPSPGGNRTP